MAVSVDLVGGGVQLIILMHVARFTIIVMTSLKRNSCIVILMLRIIITKQANVVSRIIFLFITRERKGALLSLNLLEKCCSILKDKSGAAMVNAEKTNLLITGANPYLCFTF